MYKILLVVLLGILQCNLESLNFLLVPKVYLLSDNTYKSLIRSPSSYYGPGLLDYGDHIMSLRDESKGPNAETVDYDDTIDFATGKEDSLASINNGDKIVGGDEVEINLYPYHVAYGANCGGAIIKHKWIATAAHCGKKPFIRSGSKNLNRGKRTLVARYFPHEGWSAKSKDHPFDFDFQLLELKDLLEFDENTQPIKIAYIEDMVIGKIITVTGWGNTVENGPYSDVLRAVRIPIIPKKKCQQVSHPFFRGKLTQRMFCAGYVEGKQDACQGDSGGPAVAGDRLLGTVSFGYGCAQPGSYGVYSKLATVREWLEKTMGMQLD